MQILKYTHFIIVAFLLTACVPPVHLYDGQHKSEQELAYINVYSEEVLPLKIDGKDVSNRKLFGSDFLLLEGEHSLEAILHWGVYIGNFTAYQSSPDTKKICFKVEKNKLYMARAVPSNDSNWELTIEEKGRKNIGYSCTE